MAISIFAVSFGICAIMVLTRLAELKRRKVFFLTELVGRLNVIVEQKYNSMKSAVIRKKQEAAFFITHHIPFYVWNRTRTMTSGLQKRYEKIERTVRGRNMIKQTGGEASQFIKNIVEHKNSMSTEDRADSLEDK